MSLNHPKAGPNLVGAYQLSGIPFVTGSVVAGENLSSVQKGAKLYLLQHQLTWSGLFAPA